jgi:hypothetical protein
MISRLWSEVDRVGGAGGRLLEFGAASSLSDWGFDLREAPSVLSQIVG